MQNLYIRIIKLNSTMTLAIILAILAVLVVWIIGVQNRLVKSDELCNNALKQINVQQISRFDALKALIKLTREYASYEADTLEKIVKERKIVSSPNPTAADISLSGPQGQRQLSADHEGYQGL